MGLDLPLAAAHPLRQPAGRPEALSRCLAVITRAIQTDLAQHAGLKATDGARTGIVTLIQRFGSTLNLNVHLHMLVLDGVYSWDRGRARFHRVGAPNRQRLERLLDRLIQRLARRLTRDGWLVLDPEQPWLDLEPADGLDSLTAASHSLPHYLLTRSRSPNADPEGPKPRPV